MVRREIYVERLGGERERESTQNVSVLMINQLQYVLLCFHLVCIFAVVLLQIDLVILMFKKNIRLIYLKYAVDN